MKGALFGSAAALTNGVLSTRLPGISGHPTYGRLTRSNLSLAEGETYPKDENELHSLFANKEADFSITQAVVEAAP